MTFDEEQHDESDLTVAEMRAFRSYVRGLNRLIRSIRKRYPDAQYYLSCGGRATLNIMSGSPHEGLGDDSAHPERIITNLDLEHADAGDW